MSKGKLYLMLSGFLYGIAPLFAVGAKAGGVNGITLTFLRSAAALPFLYWFLRYQGIDMHLSKPQKKGIFYLGTIGGALPILFLYLSYDYISTGLATTLHFIYPLVIVAASALLYHEHFDTKKITAAVIVTLGIFLFADLRTPSNRTGILLALLSGVLYGFYVIYIDHSGLDAMHYLKLTFYVLLIMSVSVLCFGLLTNRLDFHIDSSGWFFSILISLLVTIGAMPLFQAGVRYEGAATAGVISTLEPITSVVMGWLLLNEPFHSIQALGVLLILAGVCTVQINEVKKA